MVACGGAGRWAGLLLALPAAAVISVLVAFGIDKYKKSLLFLDGSVAPSGPDELD